MEETEYQNTMQAIKAVMNAVNSVQKIIMAGTEFVILPKQQFDGIVSVAELLFKSGKRLNYLEHKIDQVRIKKANAEPVIEQTNNKNPDALLSARQVAAEWGVSDKMLEQWRWNGKSPPYIKLGTGSKAIVRYRRKDVDDFIGKLEQRNTSQK